MLRTEISGFAILRSGRVAWESQRVSTEQLQTGDKVLAHGRVFELTQRNVADGRTSYNFVGPERPVIWFKTKLLETHDVCCMPDSWANDWTIQGNHNALWTRITQE